MVNVPRHVAVIMDRNGEWAKRRFLPRVMGHRAGAAAVKKTVKAASASGVEVLSLFAFSTENWLRPKDEVSFLMNLLEEFILKEGRELVSEGVRIVISGRIDRVPFKAKGAVEEILRLSSGNAGMVLNIALDYGGRDEILHACKIIVEKVEAGVLQADEITVDDITAGLYHPELPDIDLLIRTGGEQRLSNFMLWQLSYAELYFPHVLWPDFDEKEFSKALEEYSKRTRRFGKTDEQLKGGELE